MGNEEQENEDTEEVDSKGRKDEGKDVRLNADPLMRHIPTVAMNYRGCNDEKWAARDRTYKCAIVRTSDMTTGKGKSKQWEKV